MENPQKLPSISTCAGDTGTSSLGFGGRIPKDSLIFELIGSLDELNSLLGVCACYCEGEVVEILQQIQHKIFDVSACIACNYDPDETILSFVNKINSWEIEYNQKITQFKKFILPGGHISSAYLHLARTVCRRAERAEVRCYLDHKNGKIICQILNRLSDLLFILARYHNTIHGVQDILYIKK
ncbi:cob(I)yrinic acid a,c-diamide adenosyltransferase [Histomonas meleagridis]|uniref:cob(I)yrinic acid a,c-diamide adenosyltransferase n=1 Tax=Histomonas meleagridis TaxID=135588 RepID=UPI00355A787A|nr:cob(I)yrinic acid a,c-diamide adenosyltransferase [Histomonas meleagridis]KAH0804764.1 cob(I)yrinic acid a,c-diamide adenosyltransferase [Histomonas meleagridis]